MNTLLQDLRYGFRMLLKQKGLSAVALLSLALGIGANTALFSIVDAMLLKMLPVKEPDRLVLFRSVAPREFSVGSYNGSSNTDPETGLRSMTSFAYQSYQRMREQQGPMSDIFAFGGVGLSLNADGQAEIANGQAVTGNYYSALGVQPIAGRLLTDEDDKANAPAVAVLSHRFWEKRFGSDPAVVGKQINLNNLAFTVVGVSAKGFDGTMGVGSTQDVTIPLALEPQLYPDPKRSYTAGNVWWLRIMGRLQPGVTREQAQGQLENSFHQSVVEHRAARQAALKASGGNTISDLDPKQYPRLYADPGGQGEMYRRKYYAPSLYLLLGVVGLVLLIACANVANLLLSRAAGRQKEISLRLALGASRWRLMRQLLTESLLLAVLGGLLGILFALWIKDGLIAVSLWGGRGMGGVFQPQLDWRVLGFTLGLSLLTGIIFGLAPAWRTTRVDLTPSLKDSGRGSSAVHRSLLSRGLVVVQVALSLLLLVGAGLFVRTLLNLQRVDPGFNTQNLLLFEVQPALIGYKDEKLRQIYQQISERVEAVPGVQAVTFSRLPLLSFSSSSSSVFLRDALSAPPDSEGRIKPTGEGYRHTVRDNFLEVMGIPLLYGRTFGAQDTATSPKVVVVNQTFANKFFPGENAIGKRFTYDTSKPDELEIVGICKDAKYQSQRDDIPPTIYSSYRQERPLNSGVFEVRTAGDPTALVASVRNVVREIEPNLPVQNVKTQVEQADETLRMERLFAKLLTLFALLAQQLAAIGLFGVLAYAVSQRTHEIGIRMALGANRSNVLTMIVRQGMTLAVLGVILGLVGAWVLTKYLESWVSLSKMLFGVKVNDPLTYGLIAGLLTVVALIACYIPARRATKVDPLVALRYE
ncbi:MAG TPA: ABC transporter permease [Pyrinomonadaceae bacterium]|nr:ABC transporter permease [Pyrinomonadaceae bacterium]